MRNGADEICRENENIHFVFGNVLLFPKIFTFMRKNKKYFRAGQAADDIMAHA